MKSIPHAFKGFTFFLLLAVFITSGFGCRGTSKEVQQRLAPVSLEYWTVFSDSIDYRTLIQNYQALHPNVTINVRKLRFAEYERELLNALAEDRGPDIFSIHHTWTGEYANKIEPLPTTITLPYQFVTGTLKKELQTELRTSTSVTPAQMRRLFPDVVAQDVIRNNQVLALPLSMDTMVLYYNVDILNNAGIPEPPNTWEEFTDHVLRITRIGSEGELLQSAAAIGSANNIPRSFDLLSLIMMQNGTQMADDNGFPIFHRRPGGSLAELPAAQALDFYTSFANPASQFYTFNELYPTDIDAFINGQVAFFFGYNFHLREIQARAPKLNFGINPMLQISGGQIINYANYWTETVSRKSRSTDWAWDFLQFASRAENVTSYLESSQKPTALRSLINQYVDNPELGPFVSQLLTARSWYQGKDAKAAENAFKELITTNLFPLPDQSIQQRLDIAARKIGQTY